MPVTASSHPKPKRPRCRKHVRARTEETCKLGSPRCAQRPIGPYNHIAKVGQFITIGGTAGVDPATGQLAGADVYAQTTQILKSFKIMLEEVDSDLDHVMHINVFLKNMSDFDQMNTGYTAAMGTHRPARTVVGVNELPKTRCPAHDEAYRGDKDEDRG